MFNATGPPAIVFFNYHLRRMFAALPVARELANGCSFALRIPIYIKFYVFFLIIHGIFSDDLNRSLQIYFRDFSIVLGIVAQSDGDDGADHMTAVTDFSAKSESWFGIGGLTYSTQNGNEAYSVALNDDTFRFEVRPDDFWANGSSSSERSEIRGETVYAPGEVLHVSYSFMIEPGAANNATGRGGDGSWLVLGQFSMPTTGSASRRSPSRCSRRRWRSSSAMAIRSTMSIESSSSTPRTSSAAATTTWI